MLDNYTDYCMQAEQIQLDIDEVSKYIDSINCLKKSKFTKDEDNKSILLLLDSLAAKKTSLESNYSKIYKLILQESEDIYTSVSYMY